MAELIGTTYRAPVRELCEFTAKCGDLDMRFTPAPTAQEGIAGHRIVTARRHADYQAEVRLNGVHHELELRGRADGYDPRVNRLEEIKTYRGEFHSIAEKQRSLHWAQLKIYGALQCRMENLKSIELALIYFNVDTQKETELVEHCDIDSLEQFFSLHCDRFLAWARKELQHRVDRNTALHRLQFPHATFRHGQRELAEAVYKSICRQRDLLAQAPTGIGKTVGTLFPLLKAFASKGIDKGFFLTAKTTGRALALHALSQLQQTSTDLNLRVLELVARDKTCEYPDRACHGESCPLANGFYDRLAAAREEAANTMLLDQAALRRVALAHQVCPYYLSIEMTRWADLIIGDYNYFFDASAVLYHLTVENDWKIGILVDEAHNLIERARSMYSASLSSGNIETVRSHAPTTIKRSLGRLKTQWASLVKNQTVDYATYEAIPSDFLVALQSSVADIGKYLLKNPTEIVPELQRFYFDAMHFCNLAEVFGNHSICDIEKNMDSAENIRAKMTLRNVIPAPFLKMRFSATEATTLFSATLFPPNYHRNLLGLPEDTAYIDVPSPFSSDQLDVVITPQISTRFKQRKTSVAPIAALIKEQYRLHPGNYIAYFSSFEYLEQVAEAILQSDPLLPIKKQTSRMEEAARQAFLDAFTPSSCYVGFAVLGGVFGEGIDLPGDRLIGAFVVTLGLPQFNPINEQYKCRMGQEFGPEQSYDYAYFYPGIQKVVQAAGRVIRTPHDRGVLYLIDDRFAQPATQQLLPSWWQLSNYH